MKRYLIATIVAFSTYSAALADTVGDVLKQVAANNLTLQALAHDKLVVSQEIDFPTKYAARSKQAKMQQSVGEQLLAKQRRDILLQAQLLCIDIICANQTLAMLRERLANSETLLSMYNKRMEAGDANALELNKVKLSPSAAAPAAQRRQAR